MSTSSSVVPTPTAADLAALRKGLKSVLTGARTLQVQSRATGTQVRTQVISDQGFDRDGHPTANEMWRNDGAGGGAFGD